MGEESKEKPRVTKIWARNFRSIQNLQLGLSPLTVLVGPNASGKSNIADIPVFIAAAIRDGLDDALTTRAFVANKEIKPNEVAVGVGIETDEVEVDYSFVLRIKSNGDHQVIREGIGVARRDTNELTAEMEILRGKIVKPKDSFPASFVRFVTNSSKELAIPRIWPIIGRGDSNEGSSRNDFLMGPLSEIFVNLQQIRSYHIFPNVLRPPQQSESKYPLTETGSNLASVLREMKSRNPAAFKTLLADLNNLVPAIQNINIKSAGSHLYLEFVHQSSAEGGKTTLDASQESDGTLRLLGLLTALHQDPHPALAVIEEPELTIHPGALAYMTELMEEVAKSWMPLLITTHSPDFLDLLDIDCIRAVEMTEIGTKAGPVAEDQRKAVKERLFTPGELHSNEGLRLSGRFG